MKSMVHSKKFHMVLDAAGQPVISFLKYIFMPYILTPVSQGRSLIFKRSNHILQVALSELISKWCSLAELMMPIYSNKVLELCFKLCDDGLRFNSAELA